jgi:hypothetical protein
MRLDRLQHERHLAAGVLVCLPQAVRSRFKLTEEFDNRISKGTKKSLEESEGDIGVF